MRWTVTLRRNGTLAASTKATTKAPSGSFTVRRRLTNGSGTDTSPPRRPARSVRPAPHAPVSADRYAAAGHRTSTATAEGRTRPHRAGSRRGRRRDPERVADEPGDGGSETLYQDEFDAGRAEDLQEQLAALERAEARLADGTYGRSVVSGDAIPDARLEALPTADRTIEEQRDALN